MLNHKELTSAVFVICLAFSSLCTTQVYAKKSNKKVKQALSSIKKGECLKAESLCDEAIMIDPEWPNSYLAKGMAQVCSKRFEEAERNFKQAFELVPVDSSDKDRAAFYRDISSAYFRATRFSDSIKYSTEAISLDPSFAHAYVVRGIAYHYTDRSDLAIADLSKACSLEPWNNRYKGKLKTFKSFRDDRDAFYYKNRGDQHLTRGEGLAKYDKAIALYMKSLELDPEYTAAFQGLVWANRDKGEYERAFFWLDKWISVAPRRGDKGRQPYFERADVYMKMGEYDKAIGDYEEIIVMGENPSRMCEKYIKKACEAKGDVESAENCVSIAIPRAKALAEEKRRVASAKAAALAEAVIKREQEHYKKYKMHIDSFNSVPFHEYACNYSAKKGGTPGNDWAHYSIGDSIGLTTSCEKIMNVKLPVGVSNELIYLSRAKGMKTSLSLDVPFFAWFSDKALRFRDDQRRISALCYLVYLVRESQFRTIQSIINGYLDSIS